MAWPVPNFQQMVRFFRFTNFRVAPQQTLAGLELKSRGLDMAVCQNLVPLVNIKIAGKWMFIPLKMVLIGIDP